MALGKERLQPRHLCVGQSLRLLIVRLLAEVESCCHEKSVGPDPRLRDRVT